MYFSTILDFLLNRNPWLTPNGSTILDFPTIMDFTITEFDCNGIGMEDVKTRNMRSALQPTFNHIFHWLSTYRIRNTMSFGKINDSWEHIIIIQ